VEIFEVPTVQVIGDSEGTVWFLGALGSTTIHSLDDTGLSTHVLGRPVPVDLSSAGKSGDFVHVHGVNANGDPVHWSIDIKANGSIESGRGFLNLVYLLVGGVILASMLRYALVELRRPA